MRALGGSMFIVFGWLKESRAVQSALKCYCYVCQRSREWELWRETEWVTFFGQRTVPFLSKHALVCSSCSDTMPVTKAHSRTIGSGEIATHLEKLIHQQQLSSKTETQRRFLESIRDNHRRSGS